MTKLLLFIKTIRYLKIKQIFHRVLKILAQPSVTDKSFLYTPYRSRKWLQIKLYDEKINDNFEAVFLNYKKIELPLDWNNPSLSKLWVYNLHYFEDLLSYSSNKK